MHPSRDGIPPPRLDRASSAARSVTARSYLAARHGGRVAGVLPLVFFRSRLFGTFAVSLPFVNYGGVLADDHAVAAALLDRGVAEAQRAGCSHLELRHTTQLYP